MRTTRTSTLRFAAAIFGSGLALMNARVEAQQVPEVRPTREVFGERRQPNPRTPFSVLEPEWEASTDSPRTIPVQQADAPARMEDFAAAEQLVPVQSLLLPELESPIVDAAAASLVSPLAPPVLTSPAAPSDSELDLQEPAELPAFAPRPVAEKTADSAPTAATEDLEGMLRGMVWITATIGLAAVVSLWLLKLWLTRSGRVALPSRSLKLVDTLRIGPRCGVYLVQAETHRVLVGVEHGKTMCLMPLPASFVESLDDADGQTPEEPPAATDFERTADLFSARRHDERAKGATS